MEERLAKVEEEEIGIKSRIDRLEDAISRLTDSYIELKGIVARLVDIQANIEARLTRVEEEQVSIRSRMDRLEEAIVRLTESYTELKNTVLRLVDIQTRQEERLTKLEEAWIRSEERLAKVEERLVKVEERLVNVEERLVNVEERLVRVEERLEEHDRKFNEIMEELKVHRLKLEEHDRKFNAILEELSVHRAKLEEHTKRLEEHDRKFNEIMEELKDLRRISNEHTRILDEHTRLLAELRVSIGSMGRRLGKDMERMVLNIYKDQLMHIGIDPDKVKRFEYIDEEGKYGRKGKEYEFDIIVSNEHTDVLEVKAHTQRGDVEWFHDNVESIKTLFEKPLRRKVIVTVHVDEDALYRADILGINVIYGNIVKD